MLTPCRNHRTLPAISELSHSRPAIPQKFTSSHKQLSGHRRAVQSARGQSSFPSCQRSILAPFPSLGGDLHRGIG